MLLSIALMLLSAVTMVMGGHGHCAHHTCDSHCCDVHHHHNQDIDCSNCAGCCQTPTHAAAVYSDWSQCSLECGGGVQYRHCIQNCPQSHMAEEPRSCNVQACPTTTTVRVPITTKAATSTIEWTSWGSWSSCSTAQKCGHHGHSRRSRNCVETIHGHTHTVHNHICPNTSTETRSCIVACPTVNGGWGVWSSWSSCSVTCGNGHRTRHRTCDSPKPEHGGASCHGHHLDGTKTCTNDHDCPRAILHQCNKLSVLHALAEIDTTSKTTCLDNWKTETEGFLTDHCAAPNNTRLWHEGAKVLHYCPNITTQQYLPVGTFNNHHYGNGTVLGFAGIFVGCNAQHTGFKIATRVCGGVAEVIELPLQANYNHTSTGIIPSDPSLYSFIKWA
ncbi:A disintegrin and metalloproteinase with thrombospondin motifs 2-like isoform X2 [Mizuhopecten yessoensis]|uniref:A disintegrin and metalloproteinase with thrombospondin motifs 2-like isoform X2 n=1 Tax=Mizuhopecten yessoensis TaxID=6573 RepID=UPI000B458911|nr:A disintegrin and metalloproteinase with thrombospondin motifs 2-like isoform X2 [Mizuhopecten yessoensis]